MSIQKGALFIWDSSLAKTIKDSYDRKRISALVKAVTNYEDKGINSSPLKVTDFMSVIERQACSSDNLKRINEIRQINVN